MKRGILYTTVICLSMICLTFPAINAFSHIDQEQKIDSVSSTTDKPSSYVSGITAARARSLVGGVVGILSLVISLRGKRIGKVNPGNGRSWLIGAVALGLTAMILSIVHLTGTTGGFGTGGGKAGAIVAMALGLIGTIMAMLALYSKGR